MCGIGGYIGLKKTKINLIHKSLKYLENRGPDFKNFKEYSFNAERDKNVLFLHSRLSIIDLDSRANQPYQYKNYSIIYNGEIYNYLEIKNELEKKGINFKTTSDTEVLIKSYVYFGKRFLEKLEGMWSFAIFDKLKGKIILSRDRFGEKPLFYSINPNGIYFSSDIRVIKCLSEKMYEKNYNRLIKGQVNGYKSLFKDLNETFYKNIFQVPPSSYAEIDNKLNFKIKKYWKPKLKKKKFNKIELSRSVKEKLFKSIEIRLRSDVPIAFCLSGGVDSGAIASIAAKKFNCKVNSFSIIDDKDERYNEKYNIDKIVKDINSNHNEVYISEIQNSLDNVERLKSLINYKSAPVSTITYFLHSFLAQKISKKGFKVAFSGTAADEIYTGYYDHHLQYLYENKGKKNFNKYLNNFKTYIKPLIRNNYLKNENLYFKNKNFRNHVYDNSKEFENLLKVKIKNKYDFKFLEKKYSNSLIDNRRLNELFHEITPVVLFEDDTNSMFYSIENRSPYLDKNLFELIFAVSSENLIDNGYAKSLLRNSVSGYLHEDIRTDRQKKGFNGAIGNIFNFKDKDFINYLLDNKSEIFEFYDYKKIKNLLSKNINLNHYSKFLFSFINAKIFLDNIN